jgi:hypothetical protein
MSRSRPITKSEALEAFLESDDTFNTLTAWAEGHYSDQELADKLRANHDVIKMREIEIDDADFYEDEHEQGIPA